MPDSQLDSKLDGKLDNKPDVKPDGKLDNKLDAKKEDKCSELNGTANKGKEEVNFKLLGQRKTFNGGLEFMIECTEKE